MSLFMELMTRYRGLVIVFFVLPAGFVFDLAIKLLKYIKQTFLVRYKTHEERVRYIQEQVRARLSQPEDKRRKMCTARASWINLSTRFVNKSRYHAVDISPLHHILNINEEKRTVTVEPMVSVGQATQQLNPLGWTLACTLEVADATLGGLAIATGMTTHSHRVGLLHETVVGYDVVLADGSLVHCSKTENEDLYYALPWSHGTLGFVVAMELEIVPAKPYVRLEYIPFHTQKEYCAELRRLSDTDDNPAEFLEVTVFDKEHAVLTRGDYCDEPTSSAERAKINRLGTWYKPWWYTHVETYLEKGRGYEYVPVRDYLLRHNRSIFWVVQDMIPFGNQPWFRLIAGWLLPPKIAFLKFTTTSAVRGMTFTHQVFQDITLPMTALERSIELSEEVFDIYPVLLYPCRIYDHKRGPQGQIRAPRKGDMLPGRDYGMFYDLGVYGVPGHIKNKKQYNPVTAYRRMEEFTREVGGYPFLYADTFMNKEEFEGMFDLSLYNKVRKQYKAEGAFPTLYEKTQPEVDVVKIGQEAAKEFAEAAGKAK